MADEKQLIVIATEAVNVFSKLFDGAVVSCGSNTASVRASGTAADSVVIDCHQTNKRIALLTMDQYPDEFAIAVCDKNNPDDVKSTRLPISELLTKTVIEYMEANFAK
ncbi:hypothetical protein ACIUX2_00515 [Pseudomonas aeruginosa]